MDNPVSRQQFLLGLGRRGLLLGLAGLGAAALHGTKDVSACIDTAPCASCRVYGACALPEKKDLRDE